MRAIAARAMWTSICARQRDAGIFRRARARRFFQAARRRCFLRSWRAVCGVTKQLKLRASGGYGFRIPTYTDLYYSDPTTLGNPKLKPESAWSGDLGADWIASSRVTLSVTGFYSQQHDSIDYVQSATVPNAYLPASCQVAEIWCADNLSGLHFAGVESTFTWIPFKRQTVRIAWTGLHGAQSALHGLQSEYVFNYPVENIHATWAAALGHHFNMANAVQLAQRYQQTVYPVWNATLTHDAGRAAALSAIHESQQYGLPGDQRREHAAAHHPGRNRA